MYLFLLMCEDVNSHQVLEEHEVNFCLEYEVLHLNKEEMEG